MSNTAKSGAGAPGAAPAQKNEGANNTSTKLEVVKTPTPQVSDKLQERLKALNNLNLLNGKREKLLAKRAEVNEFELEMDGETDLIILETKDGSQVEIKRPEAIKKVLAFLKEELSDAITGNEAEILSVAA